MHSTPVTIIRLRVDQFDQEARQLGLSTDAACAEFIGIDRSTLSRLRKGEILPGERFIGACLAKFPASFEQLFEIVAESA
jgi:transcriptional regulator with XRE-family HTH domain